VKHIGNDSAWLTRQSTSEGNPVRRARCAYLLRAGSSLRLGFSLTKPGRAQDDTFVKRSKPRCCQNFREIGSIIALTFAVVMAGASNASLAWAQSKPQENEQCSMAVVSRTAGHTHKVCDDAVVKEMAKRGHVFEQNQMGLASILAVGPDYSDREAVLWFKQAALRGYAPAQVNLAVMYINGWGVAPNYGTALHWLHAAADRKFPRAYYNLGFMYLEGKGVRQDNGEAFRWFEKGAVAGDSDAQTNVGYMYDQGLGCERNVVNAAIWYRKAAEAGNALGENNLADLYLRGQGLKQDDAAAFAWFQKAAAQGHTGAQIKLAYLYADGRGTEKDSEAAYAWLSAATAAGDSRGKDLLHSLDKSLSAEQIARARQRAVGVRFGDREVSARSFAW
jgi:uncharacterized protein